jgi:hypothetical protein
MLLASLRLGILLATLVASLHVAAAPRVWTFSVVNFGFVNGYFTYDDVTNTVSNWNVHVENNWAYLIFPPFTYLPGNSSASTARLPSGGHEIILASEFVVSDFDPDAPPTYFVPVVATRVLSIYTLTPLDGSSPTVSLDPALSVENYSVSVDEIARRPRNIITPSLTLTPGPPSVVIAQVDEFYNPTLGHYFITADAAEKQALDDGLHGEWRRTGESFRAYAKGSSTSGSVNPVCRFYSPVRRLINDVEYWEGSNSHFFTADASECMTVADRWWYAWLMEGDNVFQIDLPDKTSGACPAGTIPVYRLTNQRTDSSHRYTTNTVIRTQMLAAGYLAEGYGPDGVVMCAVQ